MRGVEGDQRLLRPRAVEQRAQPIVREHALDEVLAQHGIGETSFFFDRERGKLLLQDRGIGPDAGARRRAAVVHLHALHAATRRVLLQDIPAQTSGLELRGASVRVGAHCVGVIDPGPRRDHPRIAADVHQAKRLARNPEPYLHFGAHAHPFDAGRQDFGEERIALVTAVEPDLVPQQAGRNADPEGRHPRCASDMISTRAPVSARPTFTAVIAADPNAARHSIAAAFAASSSVT